ncbi:MAG: DUF1295 domain-containing protein [Opitutales bacterium]|nr:DUF1295 domain-containing protein [Opitutales bacterium]
MLSVSSALLLFWAILVVSFTVLWYLGERRGNAAIVDVAWSWGLGLCVVGLALILPGELARRLLLAALLGFWGLRLGWHIFVRLRREDGEEGRYRYLREHWGERAFFMFWVFFQVQAFSIILLAAPIAVLMAWSPGALGLWDFLGAVWIAGALAGEAIADRQLSVWKADSENRGKTCRRGLWAWSRHPNYFFEWCHWLGYPIIGIPLLLAGHLGAWAFLWLGPVVMLWLLLRMTGIPYTEKQALRSRGEDYARYQREVSAFVPLPPKRK